MDRISWKSTSGLALAAMVCLMAAPASAGIVYNVTNDLGDQNGWSLAGTITVSAAGTYTDTSAITAWNITASQSGTNYLFANNAGDPSKFLSGTIVATSSQLLLITNGYFSLSSKNTAPYSYLNWSNALDSGMGPSTKYTAAILESPLWDTGAFSPVVSDAWVLGTTSAVPEIDPAGIGSVLALVTGALGLLERRRLKTA